MNKNKNKTYLTIRLHKKEQQQGYNKMARNTKGLTRKKNQCSHPQLIQQLLDEDRSKHFPDTFKSPIKKNPIGAWAKGAPSAPKKAVKKTTKKNLLVEMQHTPVNLSKDNRGGAKTTITRGGFILGEYDPSKSWADN